MSEKQEEQQETPQKTEIELLREEFNKKFDELRVEREKEKGDLTKQLEEKDATIADLKVQVGEQKDSIIKYQKELVRSTAEMPSTAEKRAEEDYERITGPWTAAYNEAVKRIFDQYNFRDPKGREEAEKLRDIYRGW